MNSTIYNNPLIDDVECYVAFLDILGFRELVKNIHPKEIKEILFDMVCRENLDKKVKAEAFDNANSIINWFNRVHDKLYICNVSDSIVLAIDTSDTRNLDFLLSECYKIQWYFFNKYEIIMRGAVSKGCFYGNSVLTIGKGLQQAFELEEKKAKYPRVILDRDLIRDFKELYADICDENSKECRELVSELLDYKLLLDPEDDYYYVKWLCNLDVQKVYQFCNKKIHELDTKYKNEKKRRKIERKYQWIIDKVILKH